MAYEIGEEEWEDGVRDQLDHREKGGYSQHRARFYPRGEEDDWEGGVARREEVWVTLYLGDTSHDQYAGPDSMENMAATIVKRSARS